MNSQTKLLQLLGCFIFIASSLFGQSTPDRMGRIERQLDSLSTTSIPALNDSTEFENFGSRLDLFIKSLGAAHELLVWVPDNAQVIPQNYLKNAALKDVILILCRDFSLDLVVTGSILGFYPYSPPQPVRIAPQEKRLAIEFDPAQKVVSFDLRNDSLQAFARQVTAASGQNVLVDAGTQGLRVTAFVKDRPVPEAIQALAAANGLEVDEQPTGFFTIFKPVVVSQAATNAAPRPGVPVGRRNVGNGAGGAINIRLLPGSDSLLMVEASNASVWEVIQRACAVAKKDYLLLASENGVANSQQNVRRPQNNGANALPAPLAGQVSASLRQVSLSDLFQVVLRSTAYSFRLQDGVYLLGNKESTQLTETELVKLQFRSVDSVESYLPARLMAPVEYKIFTELNALVLSGAQTDIFAVKEYLRAVDQPVPNVLIEVIVVNVQKGFDVRTGIGVGISDSAVATSGTLFPGPDLVLSSGSINEILRRIEATGIINIGRLTPNVYAELRALEENNFLEVRSSNKLSALNGHVANLKVGEQQFYLIQNQQIVPGINNFNSIQNRFESIEANLDIRIKPVVSGNEHVTLDITAEFSDFVPSSSDKLPPGKATRQFNSQIRVKNGEMIVLGGLEETTKSNSQSGLPLISRIPVLKWLFSRVTKRSGESKLVVFIKPTVVY